MVPVITFVEIFLTHQLQCNRKLIRTQLFNLISHQVKRKQTSTTNMLHVLLASGLFWTQSQPHIVIVLVGAPYAYPFT